MESTVSQVTLQVASAVEDKLKDRLVRFHDSLDSGKRFTKFIFEELSFVVGMARSMKDVVPERLRKVLGSVEKDLLAYDAEQARSSESLKERLVKRSGELVKLL